MPQKTSLAHNEQRHMGGGGEQGRKPRSSKITLKLKPEKQGQADGRAATRKGIAQKRGEEETNSDR